MLGVLEAALVGWNNVSSVFMPSREPRTKRRTVDISSCGMGIYAGHGWGEKPLTRFREEGAIYILVGIKVTFTLNCNCGSVAAIEGHGLISLSLYYNEPQEQRTGWLCSGR